MVAPLTAEIEYVTPDAPAQTGEEPVIAPAAAVTPLRVTVKAMPMLLQPVVEFFTVRVPL